MPSETADGLNSPIGEETTLGQDQVPNFGSVRYNALNRVISHQRTCSEVKHPQMFEGAVENQRRQLVWVGVGYREWVGGIIQSGLLLPDRSRERGIGELWTM